MIKARHHMNLRTLLILGRVSNLPTVWSNLLAGWALGEGTCNDSQILLIILGVSFIYVGGMYLNDYCDVAFDAEFCPRRPIPSGLISRHTVGILALAWFLVGIGCLLPFGPTTIALGLLLLVSIAFYDFHHKNTPWAPWLMGFCRFLLYPLASSATDLGFHRGVVILGGALGLYVVGITYLARGESRHGKTPISAALLLIAPVMASAGLCAARPLLTFVWLVPLPIFALLLLAWMTWLLLPLWLGRNRAISRVVSGLLAGIVLVDALLIVPFNGTSGIWLLPLFFLALLLQRFVPAT